MYIYIFHWTTQFNHFFGTRGKLSVPSYVRNTINLSWDKILLTSVNRATLVASKVFTHNCDTG
jgi:hypothetical protein